MAEDSSTAARLSLDIPTSGLVLVAKTHAAFYDLRLQLALGQMQREYCVLAHGAVGRGRELRCRVHWFGNGRQAGSVVAPAGRVALSRTKLVATGTRQGEAFSLMGIHIVTGRQHQIRLQMAHTGHPMVTDKRYFSMENCFQDMRWCRRNFLHRYRLAMFSGDARAEVYEPLPADLQAALKEVTHMAHQWQDVAQRPWEELEERARQSLHDSKLSLSFSFLMVLSIF
ncbi:unnamed protein product [Effrenium voratum]|nr:unnamed protein product [Effrenium voratum]